MEISVDVIIYFLKSIVLNVYTYFCFLKISNNKNNNLKNTIIIILLSLILSLICTYIEFLIDSFCYCVMPYIWYFIGDNYKK